MHTRKFTTSRSPPAPASLPITTTEPISQEVPGSGDRTWQKWSYNGGDEDSAVANAYGTMSVNAVLVFGFALGTFSLVLGELPDHAGKSSLLGALEVLLSVVIALSAFSTVVLSLTHYYVRSRTNRDISGTRAESYLARARIRLHR